MTWTEAQLKAEWEYVYNERLAILGYYRTDVPAPEPLHTLAKADADYAVKTLRGVTEKQEELL